MGERASGWLLVFLVLAQLALLASRVPDPFGQAESHLEGFLLRTASVPAGWVFGAESMAGELGNTWRSRQRLQEENLALLERVDLMQRELIRLQGVEAEADRLADALEYSRSRADSLRPADIVYADYRSWLRAVVIRVGEGEVDANAPVVAPSGLVGRVVVTQGRYSKVQLLTDRASSIGAMIERNRRQGVVRGRGESRLSLDYIPLRTDVRVGDRVVTAGIDGMFPRGLSLGRVTSIDSRPSELFLRVEVVPEVDFGTLDQVYVLHSDLVPETIRKAQPGEGP